MPKKKSKESKEKFDIERLDELDKLKFDKDVLSKEDKAGQDEEDAEDEESEEDLELNLGDLEFSQFMQSPEPSGDRAPVLERIAGSQPRPIFVGGIPQTPVNISGEEEKTDEFKYVPGRTGNDEPKYITSDLRVPPELTPVDLMKVGRRQTELIPQVNQEAFFMQSEPHSQTESIPERELRAEKIDTERTGRGDVFEENDARFKNYKPKLPKSY